MVDAQNPIPSPQTGDSDDVELALETATRLHRTGDHIEALKWLRRAANSADEAGDDRRQLELARAAADYANVAASAAVPVAVATSASMAPAKPVGESVAPAHAAGSPSRMPPQPPPKQPPLAPSARGSASPPPGSVSAMSVAPARPGPATGGPPPLPGKSAAPQGTSVSVAPQKNRPSEHAPPDSVSLSVAPDRSKVSESSIPPAPRAVSPASLSPALNPVPQTNSSLAPKLNGEMQSKASVPAGVAAATKPQAWAAASTVVTERAFAQPLGPSNGFQEASIPKGSLRVAVRVSARDENLYVVRPLATGQRVPTGAREAWLVFDDSGSA